MSARHSRLVTAAAVLAVHLSGAACTSIDEVAGPDEVLALVATPARLPADGFSLTRVTARIAPTADERYRDVIFSTTLGRFPASSVGGQRTITATVDSEGRAVVELQSEQRTGTATVSAEIRDGEAVKVSRSLDLPFDPVPPVEVVSLRIEAPRAPADGATTTRIVATLSAEIPLDQRTVTFTTSMGTFASSLGAQVSRSAGSSSEVAVDLISPRSPGLALVTVALGQLRVQGNLQFDPAYPDTAALSFVGSFQVEASFANKRSLRLELFRRVGQVSDGLDAAFEAIDVSTGNQFGFFSAMTPVQNGIATAEFTPGNTSERGEAILSGFVVGTFTTGDVRIEVVDP